LGDVEAIVSEVAPQRDAALAATLHERSGGNPFLLAELLRVHLAGGDEEVPESVREIVAERVRRLGGDSRELVLRAAVLGPEFETPLLAAVCGLPQASFLDALDKILERGVLHEQASGPQRLAFPH